MGNKPVNVEVTAPAVPVMITTDPIKLRQIITNLTSNAAKFTDHGKIVITLSVIGGGLEISVSDTGTGIREEHLSTIFTAFSQVEEAKTKQHAGTGLGLTISKNLAEIIGGSITVSSAFGKGTKFTVSLPFHNIERGGLYSAE